MRIILFLLIGCFLFGCATNNKQPQETTTKQTPHEHFQDITVTVTPDEGMMGAIEELVESGQLKSYRVIQENPLKVEVTGPKVVVDCIDKISTHKGP